MMRLGETLIWRTPAKLVHRYIQAPINRNREIQMKQDIGIIGLGAMGKGMAASLCRAGYQVHVCDLRPEAAQASGHGREDDSAVIKIFPGITLPPAPQDVP